MNVEISEIQAHLIGRRLGNYRLSEQLGSGGFATVYLGKHRYLGTWAAIKVLHSCPVGQELEQFMREAQIIARLTHPHIIRVLDFAVHDRTPYLVMEYAPNYTLRDRYLPGRRISLAHVVLYVQQVASALQYIHDNGFIHRDIKPGNMLVGKDQHILLSDFGISIGAPKTHAIGRQEIVGSLPYMAPEQIRGEPCVASDQYALGVVVYEWLTGTLPFEGSRRDVMHGHLYDTPPSLRGIVPKLPSAVERVVLKALEKKPEERFGSVREFAGALERAYRQSSIEARRPRSGRRKQQSHLREAAGLLGAFLVIGPVLGLILYALGLQLEIIWLFLTLCLLALPLVGMLVMHNRVALALTCSILTVSTFIGLVSRSLPAFLWIYGVSSLVSALVTFSLGIQDRRKRSRPRKN